MLRHVAMGLTLAVHFLATAACDTSESTPAGATEKASEPTPPASASPQAVAPALPSDGLPPVPQGATIRFLAPASGEFKGPLVDGKVQVAVKMGAEGIVVEPAGVRKAGSGHHHILIDLPALAAGTVVPKDEAHLHFGAGQTEAQVALTPGEHTLLLQFADGLHVSYGSALTATLKLQVVAEAPSGSAE